MPQDMTPPGGSSGGKRAYAPALAVGCAAVFAEAHDDPDRAPSDGPIMLPLEWMPQVVAEWVAIDHLAKTRVPAAYR